jgi:hypothetical protein
MRRQTEPPNRNGQNFYGLRFQENQKTDKKKRRVSLR